MFIDKVLIGTSELRRLKYTLNIPLILEGSVWLKTMLPYNDIIIGDVDAITKPDYINILKNEGYNVDNTMAEKVINDVTIDIFHNTGNIIVNDSDFDNFLASHDLYFARQLDKICAFNSHMNEYKWKLIPSLINIYQYISNFDVNTQAVVNRFYDKKYMKEKLNTLFNADFINLAMMIDNITHYYYKTQKHVVWKFYNTISDIIDKL